MYNSFCLKYWGGERIPSPLNRIFGGAISPPAPPGSPPMLSNSYILLNEFKGTNLYYNSTVQRNSQTINGKWNPSHAQLLVKEKIYRR